MFEKTTAKAYNMPSMPLPTIFEHPHGCVKMRGEIMKRYGFGFLLLLLLITSCSSVGTMESEKSGEAKKLASLPPQSSTAQHAQAPTFSAGIVPYFRPPSEFAFCGEPVPLARPDVLERFDREFTIVAYSHAQVYLWLKRAERYFPWLERQLKAKGLPDDLKYVMVAESDLLPGAKSSAGAAGIWQFIPSTGSNYGLRVANHLDERYDFERATESALQYLTNLYNKFHSWTLALAAYNCGEDRVIREMGKQRVRNYYDLKLPNETERYVFRIMAIKEVLSNPEKYGYQYIKGTGYQPFQLERVSVTLPDSIPVVDLAEAAGLTYRQFLIYNPFVQSDTLPPGSYYLNVPPEQKSSFVAKVDEIRKRYAQQFQYHVVSKGETLASIAKRYGVSIDDIKRWNQISANHVVQGQTLKIKVSSSR